MGLEKRPLIAVPVTEKKEEDIIEAFKRLTEKGADIIEWRADCFSDIADEGKVERVLSNAPSNLLFTIRTEAEGGFFSGSDDDYFSLLHLASRTKKAKIIDVELQKALKEPELSTLFQEFHEQSERALVSYHDFTKTPSFEEMEDILYSMKKCGADIAKLAVTAQNEEDAARLLSLSESFSRQNPDIDTVTISMGPSGILSRIGCFLTRSYITFASEDREKASAPGQLTYDEMKTVLSIIERNQ